MNELEQSKQLRDEARELLEQSRENLSKSIRFSDQALINQRRLALAMSNLLPGKYHVELSSELTEEEKVATFASDMANNINNREVFDIVHAINVLAISNTDVLLIFTQFSSHTNEFHVYVISKQSYLSSDALFPRLMNKTVYLSWDNALERLLAIESQLTELIIEAREKAEAKAEVES
ncbi:hypothetical protein GCS56_000037 [Vibrio metschnikovii]|uniref:hypothetical protein n=1 Tax=Vibrio metschnikovii TaxID=28172 RepID=UPI00165D6924|nr:hypothetical protein [Vibrio metschnikovii]EKO3922820.1 hypothetical protein [Vibrio metschnikovii]